MIEVNTSKIGFGQDGADYSLISTWLTAPSQDFDAPSQFEVGIVRGNGFLEASYHNQFDDIRNSFGPNYSRYLLLNTSGRIIAWNLGDKRFLDEQSLDEDSRACEWESEKCIDAIRIFVQENISKDHVINLSIYTDTDIEHKSLLLEPAFSIINSELIEYLASNPKYLHSLHWRKFEELLAEIFKNQGFETDLGPGRADGGVDLRLIQRSDIGNMLILVQAKKYAEHRKIQLDPVKALWASVEDEQANKGILVSTSEFIPAAKIFANRHPYRLELAGPEKLLWWLRSNRS